MVMSKSVVRLVVLAIACILVALVCAVPVKAQGVIPLSTDPDPITMTGVGCIKNLAGSPIANGSMLLNIVDGNGKNVPVNSQSGWQITNSTVPQVITSGSIASITIPNPANTSLSPYYLHVSILDKGTNTVTNYPKVQVMLNDVTVSGRYTQFNWCKVNTSLASGATPVVYVQGPPGPTGTSASGGAALTGAAFTGAVSAPGFTGPVTGTASGNVALAPTGTQTIQQPISYSGPPSSVCPTNLAGVFYIDCFPAGSIGSPYTYSGSTNYPYGAAVSTTTGTSNGTSWICVQGSGCLGVTPGTNQTVWYTRQYQSATNTASAWSSATNYTKHTFITYGGNTYMAAVPNTNKQPDINPFFWSVANIVTTGGVSYALADEWTPTQFQSCVPQKLDVGLASIGAGFNNATNLFNSPQVLIIGPIAQGSFSQDYETCGGLYIPQGSSQALSVIGWGSGGINSNSTIVQMANLNYPIVEKSATFIGVTQNSIRLEGININGNGNGSSCIALDGLQSSHIEKVYCAGGYTDWGGESAVAEFGSIGSRPQNWDYETNVGPDVTITGALLGTPSLQATVTAAETSSVITSYTVGSALVSATVASGGTCTGYLAGDTGTVTQAGGSGGTYTVTTTSSGCPTAVTVAGGSGYATQPAQATAVTTGGGNGGMVLNLVATNGSGYHAAICPHNFGTGFVNGDTYAPTESGASGLTCTVTSVDGNGMVTGATDTICNATCASTYTTQMQLPVTIISSSTGSVTGALVNLVMTPPYIYNYMLGNNACGVTPTGQYAAVAYGGITSVNVGSGGTSCGPVSLVSIQNNTGFTAGLSADNMTDSEFDQIVVRGAFPVSGAFNNGPQNVKDFHGYGGQHITVLTNSSSTNGGNVIDHPRCDTVEHICVEAGGIGDDIKSPFISNNGAYSYGIGVNLSATASNTVIEGSWGCFPSGSTSSHWTAVAQSEPNGFGPIYNSLQGTSVFSEIKGSCDNTYSPPQAAMDIFTPATTGGQSRGGFYLGQPNNRGFQGSQGGFFEIGARNDYPKPLFSATSYLANGIVPILQIYSAAVTIGQLGIATSSSPNYLSVPLFFTDSWNDGTNTHTDNWRFQLFQNGNTSAGSSSFQITSPNSAAKTGPDIFSLINPVAATSSQNQPAPEIYLQGNCWSTATSQCSWGILPVIATGANPAATLNFTYFGGTSSGLGAIQFNTPGGVILSAAANATSGNTIVTSEPLVLNDSWWNGTSAQLNSFNMNFTMVSAALSGSPTFNMLFPSITGLTGQDAVIFQNTTFATSGLNQTAPYFSFQGYYWNASASAQDVISLVPTYGSGSNPTVSLALAHTGSSGGFNFSVPYATSLGNLTLTSATPTVTSGQVGFGTTTAVVSNCGSLSGSTKCLAVNDGGTTRYVPMY